VGRNTYFDKTTQIHKEYARNGHRCPRCAKKIRWHPKGYFFDGRPAPWFAWSGPDLAECPHCGERWPIYETSDPAAAAFVVETSRREEPIGDELRRVDNSGSSRELTRRLTISRRWAQTVEVHAERAQTGKQGIQVGGDALTKFTAATETAVKHQYSISTQSEQTYAEEITFTVPARTILEVRLCWKRIWQQGYVRVTDHSGTVDIPFQVVVGVTFDQEHRDLPRMPGSR
jgi:hypothetical protein